MVIDLARAPRIEKSFVIGDQRPACLVLELAAVDPPARGP
jgi:hypothetical protein